MSIRLEIEPSHRSALQQAGLCDFTSFMQAAGKTPVSRHRHRETVPIDIPFAGLSRRYYLKRVFRVAPAHSLLPWFRLQSGRSQPVREWEACSAFSRAGLPAMKRAAVGERRVLGIPVEAFVLVEGSSFSHAVDEWLVPGFPRPQELSANDRGRLLFELGALIRKICVAGFDWPDLHAKHILAEPVRGASAADGNAVFGESEAWQFCLIDLERVRRAHPAASPSAGFSPKLRTRILFTLARFIQSLSPLELPGGVRQQLARGAGVSGNGDTGEHDYLFDSRPGRLPRLPDDYVHPRNMRHDRAGGVCIDRAFASQLRSAGISTLEDAFQSTRGESLRKPGLSGHRDRIRLECSDGGGPSRILYMKRYHHPPIREQLRRLIETRSGDSMARHEARCARLLWGYGIGTMRVAAYGEAMSGPFERRSFIVTDGIDGVSLEALTGARKTDSKNSTGGSGAAGAHQGCPAAVSSVDRHEIIRQLAWLVRQMHGCGLFHRDLYPCHVFLTRNADGGVVLRLIDLARMIERPLRPWRWRVKDLAALDYGAPVGVVTRADRVRFLYHYLSEFGDSRLERASDRARFRGLSKSVRRRTEQTARHDARRKLKLGTSERA